jgi:hypothetical protein
MAESDALKERRKHKEQMLLQAKQRVESTLNEEELATAISYLYVDWGNSFTQEHASDLSALLKQAGVLVEKHDSGSISYGDNYPTEYHISVGNVRGSGPTFDMALADFIQQQMKSYARLLKDLRAYINHDVHRFPSLDTQEGMQSAYNSLLGRVAKIIGED